jgi:hypothetical protein
VKRTTLAVALATGALAVPGVALATSGGDSPTQPEPSTAPVQQQEQQQRPDREPCPEDQGGNGGGSSSEETQL